MRRILCIVPIVEDDASFCPFGGERVNEEENSHAENSRKKESSLSENEMVREKSPKEVHAGAGASEPVYFDDPIHKSQPLPPTKKKKHTAAITVSILAAISLAVDWLPLYI